jgi:hypothetical protein
LDDLEQVARLRISGGAQHPHQALGRPNRGRLSTSNCTRARCR